MSKQFVWPKKFLWGASSASHQVEGGNINNWSVWELQTAAMQAKKARNFLRSIDATPEIKKQAMNPGNYVSGRAVDHYNRFEEDFDIMVRLGLNAYRFSIEWSRIQPEEGVWNTEAVEYYRNYLRELRNRGIEPVMTLYHWSVPIWFAKKGGFERRSNIKYFVEYAEHLLRVLSDEVTHIVTINEPDTVALMGYGFADHPPGNKSFSKFIAVYVHLLIAHKKVYKIAKKLNKNFNVGFVKTYAYVRPFDEKITSKLMVRVDYLLRDDLPLAYIGNATDFLGVNYYFTDHYKSFKHMHIGNERSDVGWPLNPENLEHVLKRLVKAGKPMMITETGVADSRDVYRKNWIQKTILSIKYALEDGVDVRGYMHWSLTDNFEWAYGRWPAFGLVAIDYENNLKRTIRPSAVYYAKVIKGTKRAPQRTNKTKK